MIAIYKRDLKALYKTPVGYVFSGTLLLLFYVLFYVYNIYTTQTADISVVMGNLIYWLFLPIPILTMRLMTEEYRQKTDQLLLTAPVSCMSIVLGKFLAGMVSFLITIVLSLAIPVIITIYGELLGWTMIGNYIALIAAAAVGLVGRLYAPELVESGRETIFIVMVRGLFPGFLAGILLSAILAASMSTADSQLLVSASAFASDVYKPIIRKNKASNKEIMNISRLIVIIIAIVALLIAINPDSGSIMDLVENAWAGFASAFGPAILLSLFWKRFTYKGACAGIIVGAVVDVLWLEFLSGPTGLYEIIPGFLVGLLACVIVTLLDKEPSEEIKAYFDKAASFKD